MVDQNLRRNHTPGFKAKVALEAIKEQKTIAQLATEFGIHPTQIGRWKTLALSGLERIFSERERFDQKIKDEFIEKLYQQIGKQKVEIDFLKKKMGLFES